MNSTKILILTILLAFQSCKIASNSKAETIFVSDFNWTVTVPKNFNLINADDWDEIKKEGIHAVENTIGEQIVNEVVTIFNYRNGDLNNFEAIWQPFNIETDGDYLTTHNEVNEILYQTFENQMPGVKLDSLSSIQIVDDLEFQRFDLEAIFPNGIKLTTIGFSRLFDMKEFTLNITSVDEEIEKKMIDAFLNSKFE